MCGISGIINHNLIDAADHHAVQKMMDSLVHRGPDDSGLYKNKNVVLGHRRLSIIDINRASSQPMLDDTEQIIIVFNGEIYNHQQLRNELEDDYTFLTSHSDTEVIIYAYKKWGIDCLKRLTGMFAFCLHDIKLNKTYLCRDRLGKKPLYYTSTTNGIYFSSESSALFASGNIDKKINEQAIYDYLSYLTVEAPNTFFNNIFKLPAGHFVEIQRQEVILTKYWDIAEYLNLNCKDSTAEVVRNTKLLLDKSMEYRNVSDVPIAVALSGGLDSSLNLAYAKNISKNKLIAINVSYKDKSEFDESDIAKKFSKELDVEFVPICIDQNDYEKWILEYFEAQKDTPIGDPNSPLLYGISKVAAQHGCKVLLVGEGGDELGGYPVYNSLKRLNQFSKLIPKILLKLSSALPLPLKYKRELDVLTSGGAEARRFLFGFTDNEKNNFWKGALCTSSFLKLSKYADEIRDDLEDSFLRKVLNIEYKVRLADLLLPRIDYPSMAASVEARSPFMDHELIEYSSSIPFSEKMKVGPKTIIRNIASKILPKYLMEQPKVGFGMLLNPFLNNELPIWFKEQILDCDSPISKFIEKKFLNKIYEKHLRNKTEGYRMWILFSLNKWLVVNE